MRQPFFSIAAAAMFMLLGLYFGANAASNVPFMVLGGDLGSSAGWGASGLSFLMAYFSLVHLKYR